MPVRHSGSARGVRRQRRKLVWATFDNSFNMGAGLSVKVIDLLNQFELAGASKLGVTIMRIHGMVQYPTAITQGWELGIKVDRITDVGTQLPNPNADNDLDWMLFDRPMATFSGATVDSFFNYKIDLKSHRKCQEMGETLVMSTWASAANAGTVQVFTRTLVALP